MANLLAVHTFDLDLVGILYCLLGAGTSGMSQFYQGVLAL